MQSPKPAFSIRRPPEKANELEHFVAGVGEAPAVIPTAIELKPEARRRVTLTRRDGRVVRRMNLCLPEDTARALAVYCAERDLDMSAFVSEAVAQALSESADTSGR